MATATGNTAWILSDMADGAYDFRVDSVDIAGNRASDTPTVTVDTQAGIDIDDLGHQRHPGVTTASTNSERHHHPGGSGSERHHHPGWPEWFRPSFSGSALVGSDGLWLLGQPRSVDDPRALRGAPRGTRDLAGNRVIDGAPLIGQSDTPPTLSEADPAEGPVSATGSPHTGAGLDGNLR